MKWKKGRCAVLEAEEGDIALMFKRRDGRVRLAEGTLDKALALIESAVPYLPARFQ